MLPPPKSPGYLWRKAGEPSAADETEDPAAGLQVSPVVEIASELNPNKRGVVLPVFTDSPDTVRFTIYRAKAVGARRFGEPEVIANLEYDNPEAADSGTALAERLEAHRLPAS